ncbi:MAG: dihydrofolate reductase [Fuerstiella sp.]
MLTFLNNDIVVIGAMSESGAIGNGDGMPWNVPEEYQHFVDSVRDKTVIMGRRSYDIFGADFDADTFVLSHTAEIAGATVCRSFDDAISQAKQLHKTIFIAGGASIYELGIPAATRLLLSTIKGDYHGDVSFPNFNRNEWEVVWQEDRPNYILRDWRRNS